MTEVDDLIAAIAGAMADEFATWMRSAGFLAGGPRSGEVSIRVAKLMAEAWMAARTRTLTS